MTNKNNTGDCNTGNCNTGSQNSGSQNSGSWNSGHCNTGYRNTGDLNSGNCNTGGCNTGGSNTGNWNTGGQNSGSQNSGNWNTGDRNTGFLNTDTPTARIFNKDSGMGQNEIRMFFPDYFYFNLTEWVYKGDMTEAEKEENPGYETTGGYLKVYGYKEAWRRAWDKASEEDKKKTLELPNWDNNLFFEISGIDVEKELSSPKEYSMDEIAESLGIDVKDLKIKKE